MRSLAALLAAVLLVGCATARPAVTADATEAERVKAEACHVRATERAEAAVPYIDTSSKPPPKEWAWWEIALAPVVIAAKTLDAAAIGALAIATSPVWVPWWVTRVHNQRADVYQRAYADCMAGEARSEAVVNEAASEWTP